MRRLLLTLIVATIALPSALAAPSEFYTPADRAIYNASSWNAVVGQANTSQGTIGRVDVAINNTPTDYWDGTTFVPGGEQFVQAVLNPQAASDTLFTYAFTPPASGNYSFKSIAVDSSGSALESASAKKPSTIIYDTVPPTVSLSPLPPWTGSPFVAISWTGSDAHSWVIRYRLYNNETDAGVPVKGWTLAAEFLGAGSYQFGPLEHNHTYYFNITAQDAAYNTNSGSQPQSTTADLLPPVCAMTVPPFIPSTFLLRWNVTENVSGMQNLDVEYSLNGGPWQSVSPPCTPFTATDTSTLCQNMQDGNYSFRCRGTDNANNPGPWSLNGTGAVDSSPDASVVMSPSQYTNSYPFTLSWIAIPSGPSGVQCFNVMWNTTTVLTNITNATGGACLHASAMTFGDGPTPGEPSGDPVIQQDEKTYFFHVRTKDGAGNIAAWKTANTTVDTTPPKLGITAIDQDGKPLVQGANITQITVTTTAADANPLATHIISIEVTSGQVKKFTKDCSAQQDNTQCSDTQSALGADQVIYYATVTDSAGNVNTTPQFLYAVHPLTNFVSRYITFPTGVTVDADIQMRNLESAPVDLTLAIDGYSMAGFTTATGAFTSSTIAPDARSIHIESLQPMGTGTANIQLIASDPTAFTPFLNLTANSSTGMKDRDIMHLTVLFPASFDGLNSWGIIFLLAISAAAFVLLKK